VQCLERRANEVDIAGLLGLANFLVFADTIVFGNQKLDSVQEPCERLQGNLALDHVTRPPNGTIPRLMRAERSPSVDTINRRKTGDSKHGLRAVGCARSHYADRELLIATVTIQDDSDLLA
jgi:hypothetical protein